MQASTASRWPWRCSAALPCTLQLRPRLNFPRSAASSFGREHGFEVVLFAEMFQEMLQQRFGRALMRAMAAIDAAKLHRAKTRGDKVRPSPCPCATPCRPCVTPCCPCATPCRPFATPCCLAPLFPLAALRRAAAASLCSPTCAPPPPRWPHAAHTTQTSRKRDRHVSAEASSTLPPSPRTSSRPRHSHLHAHGPTTCLPTGGQPQEGARHVC